MGFADWQSIVKDHDEGEMYICTEGGLNYFMYRCALHTNFRKCAKKSSSAAGGDERGGRGSVHKCEVVYPLRIRTKMFKEVLPWVLKGPSELDYVVDGTASNGTHMRAACNKL